MQTTSGLAWLHEYTDLDSSMFRFQFSPYGLMSILVTEGWEGVLG